MMACRSARVNLSMGLHARPATRFVELAGSFQSDLRLTFGGKQCNPKSIIHLLTLSVHEGACIELRAAGPDEQEALDTLCAFVESFD